MPPKKPYDPVAAHEYYIRTRKLKGRQTGQSHATNPHASSAPVKTTVGKRTSQERSHQSPTVQTQRAEAKVKRLTTKVSKLQGALNEALVAYGKKRRAAEKTKKESSDGKTTAKERRESKEYRDKNKTKLAAEAKKDAKSSSSTSKSSGSKSSSSSSSGSSAPKSVSSMSVSELSTRVNKIRTALNSAKKQLSDAKKDLSSLSHSDGSSSELLFHSSISRKESVKMVDADFGGYATRNDVTCSDGRTILRDAFKENHETVVPLLWQHDRSDPENVLGHCKLENRPDGVYAQAYFNKTPKAQAAKEQVQHGDIKHLSIFANNLVERAKQVMRGTIKEVSLVVAGANPGAIIDNVAFSHSDGTVDYDYSEAVIMFQVPGNEIDIMHADADADTLDKTDDDEDEELDLQEIIDSLDEKQTIAFEYLVSQALAVGSDVKHSEEDSEESKSSDEENADETEGVEESDGVEDDAEDSEDSEDDAENTDNDEAGEDVQHDNDNQEDNSMTHNVFDQAKNGESADVTKQVTLSHSDVKGIMMVAEKRNSLEDAVKEYALEHGIQDIEYLFPDAKNLDSSPNLISRRMEWVSKVLDGVRRTPYARIKSVNADITEDEARAKGYVKGEFKKEEFFKLLKRTTTPQTVYKKQRLDRDDVIDITELDVIAFVKAEMKLMLDEEIAGAILIGDGRSNADEDKINTDNIRPIASDDELYVTTVNVNLDDAGSSIEELVDAVIANRKYYKGTGMPTFYCSDDVVSAFLQVKDGMGRRIYDTLDKVATLLRVREIVPVEVFDRDPSLVGIMVNLSDYAIGTDRGGQATMFDDFDLDFNKLIYLLETRLCGALVLPKSALVFRKVAGTAVLRVATPPTRVGNVVTVPTVTGVTYKNEETGTTLVTASPVTLDDGDTLHVKAYANAGGYFANDAEDEWLYSYED